MSNGTKWFIVLVVVVLVVLGLWWGGFLGGATPVAENSVQTAAVAGADETAAPVDTSNATIAAEAATIVAQMKVAGNQTADFGQKPTVAKANLLAGQLGGVASLIIKLSSRIQIRVSTLKSLGYNTNAAQGALSDMNLQVNYAVSSVGLGGKAATEKSSTALPQSVIEMQKAHNYLKAAQMDIKSVIAALAAIDTSKSAR